ncbi:hypothetical protein BV20DRAFT_1058314 [Pilatotrama ljubarskyi]|nr:hypothetical protein BV20DRAFT_1058314 [Pilatotrama ljubarskyi]
MEHSRLPIELSEYVIEALSWHDGYPDSAAEAQANLYACALTCRAWRPRAQFILWREPWVTEDHRVIAFIAVLRCIAPSLAHHVRALGINHLPLSGPGDLFLLSLPNLKHLHMFSLHFDAIAVPPSLRTRLMLCAAVIHLELSFCTFDSLRTIFDIIWSCPQLRFLDIFGCTYRQAPLQEEQARLAQAARNLKACRNLTHLDIFESNNPRVVVYAPGGTFGSALTTLRLSFGTTGGNIFRLPPLLDQAFPYLRDVEVRIRGHNLDATVDVGADPFLHQLAAKLSTSSMLKRLSLLIDILHVHSTRCCRALFGAGDTAVPGDQTLRSLLPNSVKVTVDFQSREEDYDPGTCARYITLVLPSMHDVLDLRNRYRRKVLLPEAESLKIV